MPHLIVREAGCVAYSLALHTRMRAGRERDNELVLPDRRVSRYHLELTPIGDTFVVQDLDSKHGVFVNDVKIVKHRLADGDVIQFGAVTLTYHADDDPSVSLDVAHTDPSASPPSDRAERRVQLLCALGEAIGSTRDTEAFLLEMIASLRDALGCERILVGLGQTPRDRLRKISRSDKPGDEVVLSASVVEKVLGRRERWEFVEALNAQATPTMRKQRIRVAVCVPMIAGTRMYGFIYADDRREIRAFSLEDMQFLGAVARLAASVLDATELVDARRLALDRTEIVGESLPIVKLRENIVRFGATKSSVLILGETGTGKELVARALHAASPRRAKQLVAINCAAMPEGLVESELFGHLRGAFTGAMQDKKGKFVLAHQSTLFLDEIGDLSLSAQAKVLRALQEGEVEPVGASEPTKVDVRIVAATHKDLVKEVAAGRFRQDLYYRLCKIELKVPPLREREGDVALLARSLLPRLALDVGKPFSGITPEAIDVLQRYSWPGNVRELSNELERALLLAESSTIGVGDLGEFAPRIGSNGLTGQTGSLAERYLALDKLEQQLVEEALDTAEGNKSEAARLLGMTWVMLKKRIARYGLNKKKKPSA